MKMSHAFLFGFAIIAAAIYFREPIVPAHAGITGVDGIQCNDRFKCLVLNGDEVTLFFVDTANPNQIVHHIGKGYWPIKSKKGLLQNPKKP